MLKEFKEFLLKQNALALAIGVVVGAAVGKVVSGIVDDIIMPIVGILLPGGEWRNAQWVLSGNNAIKYGDLAGRLIDFTIVSGVVFLLVKAFLREKPKPQEPVRSCPYCLELLPLKAVRCRACTAEIAPAA